MRLHQTQVADFHLELAPSGKLPQAILGDTWIAVAAEAQFAASMSVAASTDAGIANAAVPAAAPLHKFWHTHFLCFCPNPKCSISTALTTRELFFKKKKRELPHAIIQMPPKKCLE
jgi:hypothetical protein